MNSLILYFKDELGIDLDDLSHPISKKINSIKEYSANEKGIKKHYFNVLGLALMKIKEYDDNIFKAYLKKIINNKDISIYGHIFEIKQCDHIIEVCQKENLEFIFGNHVLDEPDFFVNKCGFEITSTRYSDLNNQLDPSLKLLQTFRKKNTKNYANLNTVLLIDITELSYQTYQNNLKITTSLYETLAIIKKEIKFGCVLCLLEIIQTVGEKTYFNGNIYNVYSENCTKELRDLIESKFLKNNFSYFNSKFQISPY